MGKASNEKNKVLDGETLERELVKRLGEYKKAPSTGTIRTRLARKASDVAIETALTKLRDAGVLACTNGAWWIRKMPAA